MNNQKGLGLIEILVVIAIMSVVMAGVAQVGNYAAVQQTTTNVKTQGGALAHSVSSIALNDVACTAAITKVSQRYGTAIRFDLPDSSIIAYDIDVPAYSVYSKALEFDGKLVATGGDGSKAYYGTLQLTLGTHRQVLGPTEFAPMALGSIFMTVSSAGTITHCGSIAPILPAAALTVVTDEEVAYACKQIGGTMNGKACVFPPKNEHDGPCDHN